MLEALVLVTAGWFAHDLWGRQRYARFARMLTAQEIETLDRVAANVAARRDAERMRLARFTP